MNRPLFLPWLCSGNTIMTVAVEEPGTITIPESSAVGTVVGVLVVLALLGAGVAYYAHTNRRMRHRLVLCNAPSVPQPVVQSRRRPLLGPSPG